MMRRRRWLTVACAAPAALSACAWLPREAKVPMPVIWQRAVPDGMAPLLVVMLPGAYSVPRDFIDEGFIAALRAQRYAVDAVMADAHLGYAENGTLLDRLHDDVLKPARDAGYRRIWLVGISFGALSSLGLTMRHAEMIEGVLAMAPYLGRPALVQQITAAGGAEAYARAASDLADPEAALWRWLGRTNAAQRATLHLYTGSSDRLIAGQRLMAALLPPDHVLEVPGTHDWPAWQVLWQRWLARAPWPRLGATTS
jgi:hypothetical protein